MGSLIPSGTKLLYEDQFNKIHDTFARPIYIFRENNSIVINSNPGNNNFFQNAPFNDTVITTAVSGMFNARILYSKREDLEMFEPFGIRKLGGDQVNIQKEAGAVRIKLDPTGASYLFDAKRVTFDGEVFTIRASKRPHGLFTPKFFDFYLQKEN
jgi:hypothetical protein